MGEKEKKEGIKEEIKVETKAETSTASAPPSNPSKFFTDRTIFLWTFILIALPTAIFSFIGPDTSREFALLLLIISTVIVFVMLFATVLLFRELGYRDHKANYILSINIAIAIYHITSILGIFCDMFLNISDKIFTFIQPIIVIGGCVFAIRYYDLNLNLNKKFIHPSKIMLALALGALFGLLFWVLREPIVSLFKNTIPVFIVYTLLIGISEELLFRFIIFRLAERAFTYKTAMRLQALVFAAIHFISFRYILGYYSLTPTILAETAIVSVIIYFVALYYFGIVCGKLVGIMKSKQEWVKGNIVYAIIVHWVTNFVVLFLSYI